MSGGADAGIECDASFTVSATPRVNAAVTFTAQATAGATYAWSFPDATPSTSSDPMPTVMFATTANHAVSLTVTRGKCSMTSMQTICTSAPGTQTFDFTGAVQTFNVPACISSVRIDAFGAAGGAGTAPDALGGLGGLATGTASVTPGEVLNLFVGGVGMTVPTTGNAAGFAGGFNGGGKVFEFTGWNGTQAEGASGSGGGASDVRQGGAALANRIIVAGGGGGGSTTTAGGAGGGTTGGTAANGNFATAIGGGGGSQTAGGITTDCCTGYPNTPGVLGIGGDSYRDGAGTGGGGGGYYGGGGGQFAGGGGGSSFLGTLATTSTTAAVQSGNGKIVLTW